MTSVTFQFLSQLKYNKIFRSSKGKYFANYRFVNFCDLRLIHILPNMKQTKKQDVILYLVSFDGAFLILFSYGC